MSSLALMRWLEATPERYDAGMRLVTLGRVGRLHEAVAEAAVPRAGARVLEIGCGTGSVTQHLLERGAEVVALDQSAAMLERARARVAGPVEWLERTASEIDSLEEAGFDSVVLSLSLSEMSSDERRFVLAQSVRRLRPGGRLVVADEVRAEHFSERLLQRIGRAPQWLLAWLLAGSISQVIPDLRDELEACGVEILVERRWLVGSLALFVCCAGEGS